MSSITFSIITVSDRCFQGQTEDVSGLKLHEAVIQHFPESTAYNHAVPDDRNQITVMLKVCARKSDVVLTTGGTGFSPRDVTPEATREVIERQAPGLAHAMMSGSLQVAPMAMLSRAVCGILGKTVIINLPGSPKAAVECFGFIKNSLRHAVDLLSGNLSAVEAQHKHAAAKSKVVLPSAAKRARKSPFEMLEVDVALKMVKQDVLEDRRLTCVDLSEALHRVLAEDVYSREPLPPFPASMKDGYAVVASDGAGQRNVREVVAAGDQPSFSKLRQGEIVRINTGAPVPPGADAVVQVEDTHVVKESPTGEELVVDIKIAPKIGQDIRPIGCDIPKNVMILKSGEVITPAHIGVFASIGMTKIKVTRQHSIGLISTGNELQDSDEPLKPGHIRDSNKYALTALLRQHNYKATDCGSAKDNPDDILRVLTGAFANHDVVITTGGVSMGEFDVVQKVLTDDFGATIRFGRVNMKPGKPTTFAVLSYQGRAKYVFALPGNPVSAMVTTILFALPALKAYERMPETQKLKVCLGESISLDSRPEYMRAWAFPEGGKLVARQRGDQISSRLNSFIGSNVLLVLPGRTETLKELPKGTEVDAIKLDSFYT